MVPVTMLNAVTSNTTSAVLNCQGADKVKIFISGNFQASIVFEGTLDTVNWFSLNGCAFDNLSTSFADNPTYVSFDVEGLHSIRVRTVRYLSGAVTVVGYVESARTVGSQYSRRNTATAGTVLSSVGTTLQSVVVGNAGSAMIITIHDGTSAAGAVVASLSPTAPGTFSFNARCTGGLFVVITATTMGDVTFVFA